jgi:hypothetical protein
MPNNESPPAAIDPWPLRDIDLNEVAEMARIVRTLDDFEQFKGRHPGVRVSHLSARMLCGLYLQDMHAQAGMPVLPEHY